MAIPGVLPPFEKNGSVYVDGGVCSNLPVNDMREYLDGVGKVIAFDIRIPPFHRNDYHFPPALTLKNMVACRLGFRKYRYVLPALFDILMESSSIGQYMYDTKGAEKADIMVAPDTSAMSFFNPKRGELLLLLAYELAKQKFNEKKDLYKRWTDN